MIAHQRAGTTGSFNRIAGIHGPAEALAELTSPADGS